MADDKRSMPGESRRRRPAPTIDLTASEVPPPEAEAAPVAESAAAAAPQSSPSPIPRFAAYAIMFIAGVAASVAVLWSAGILSPRLQSSDTVGPRLAALEAQLRELAQRPTPRPDNKAIDDMSQRLDKIEQAVNRPPQTDGALVARIAAVESGVKTALNRADEAGPIEALGKRLDAIEQSAKATQDKVTQSATADVAARRMLAAFALRDAVTRGAPYAAELAAMKGLDADPATLAALSPFADNGVPTDATLQRDLRALLPSMIDAANADPSRSGGFLDRIEANAGRLVRIRPVGEPAGDDAAAVLSRIEVKLAHNDIAGVESELGKLPVKARALAEPWRKMLFARNSALAASRKLVADSAGALGGR